MLVWIICQIIDFILIMGAVCINSLIDGDTLALNIYQHLHVIRGAIKN
jgi:hypothetical protein